MKLLITTQSPGNLLQATGVTPFISRLGFEFTVEYRAEHGSKKYEVRSDCLGLYLCYRGIMMPGDIEKYTKYSYSAASMPRAGAEAITVKIQQWIAPRDVPDLI